MKFVLAVFILAVVSTSQASAYMKGVPEWGWSKEYTGKDDPKLLAECQAEYKSIVNRLTAMGYSLFEESPSDYWTPTKTNTASFYFIK